MEQTTLSLSPSQREAKLGWLRGLLPFEHGVPSHDTLTRVFGQVEPSEFERCFRAWTRRIEKKTDGQVVAVDGKTLRGNRDRTFGGGPLHLVEAWATGQELMLGQKRSEDGSSEIATIPRHLEVLTLEGCVATTDAMSCQTDVAEAITEAGADRQHWQIENGLHWVLDVVFEEDHSQVRTQNAAENLALVRRLVVSPVKQDDRVDAGTKDKRKRAVRRRVSGASATKALTCNRPNDTHSRYDKIIYQ